MNYDLCIIGAGWAGFNAAIHAAKLGKKVCIIEKQEIGGTCLNKGCIPTKAFVQFSKQHLSLAEIQKKKDDIVSRLRTGMSYLVKTNKVDYFQGDAKIIGKNKVLLSPDKEISASFILIATGSVSRDLPELKIDHKIIISSEDCLGLTDVPKKILIVGAGAIGCEFASIFKRLGSDVTLVEIAQEILPGIDNQVSKKLHQSFQKNGIIVQVGQGIKDIDLVLYDKVLLSVGRKSVTEGIWQESIGIKVDKGIICVDRELRTDVRNIFAAGDCIGGYMLAHVASYEGELAVNNMFLKSKKRDYTAIPASIFSTPEVSSIGICEDEAKKFGCSYKAHVVHFLSIGMAHVLEDTQGFVKVIAEEKTGRILGASIIGLQATELVNSFSLMMQNKLTIKDLKNTILAHPSVSEILGEIARTFD